MAHLALALALALAAAGCKESATGGPVPEPTRAPPPGFEDVDTAERPDASAPLPGADAGAPAQAKERRTDERSTSAGAAKSDATMQAPRGTSNK